MLKSSATHGPVDEQILVFPGFSYRNHSVHRFNGSHPTEPSHQDALHGSRGSVLKAVTNMGMEPSIIVVQYICTLYVYIYTYIYNYICIYIYMYRVYVSCTTYIPNPTPIPTSRIPALMAFTISSYFAGFDRRQVRSTTETSGVGTRKAILGSDQWTVTLWLCQNSY